MSMEDERNARVYAENAQRMLEERYSTVGASVIPLKSFEEIQTNALIAIALALTKGRVEVVIDE